VRGTLLSSSGLADEPKLARACVDGNALEAGRGAGTLQIAARDAAKIQSQNAHIDWAAAKKITLATAGGASIVIEGGNITVACPGTITVKASAKRFAGPEKINYPLPIMPREICVECLKRRIFERTAFVKKGA
jgi:type VI secretion system secreted protein VgrG